MIIRLTSALPGRATVYVNTDHIISFSDQTGGCSLKMTATGAGNNVLAVTESAETILLRINDASGSYDGAIDRVTPAAGNARAA